MHLFLKLLVLGSLLLHSTAAAITSYIPNQSGTVIRYYHPRTAQVVKPEPPKPAPQSWQGYFSAKRFNDTPEDKKKLLTVRQNLQKSFASLFPKHLDVLNQLEVNNVTHKSRGLAGSHKIILNIGTIDTNDEMISVFTHEMGHVVDLGYFQGSTGAPTAFVDRKKAVLSDDPSVQFYQISWMNNDTKKQGVTREDFVSGYSMSNPFEDFAESFAFYRYHGEKFRALATRSPLLKKKYAFLKYNVFDGTEFQTETVYDFTYRNNAWDITLLPLPTNI